MKKSRMQKGITLIALIITIIVLLILAVVAIGAVQNDGIIDHAKNARDKYQQAQANEQTLLNSYLSEIEENGPNGEKIGKATVGTKVTVNSTIDGKAYSSTNPVIPAGFKAINTETSSWDAETGPEVTNGLVIQDDAGNEFVWIPVPTLSEFARPTSGKDTKGRTNYQGVLYDFSGITATEKTNYGQSTTSYREPANLSTEDDNTSNLSIWTPNLYQESFNKMVESVAKYKGFYVGRYETSLNGSIAQSKSGYTPMNNINWFRMYENSLTYSSSNTSLGVQSEMIWGCQWDAMLKFILTGSEADHVTSNSNAPHDFSYLVGTEEVGYYEETYFFMYAPYSTGGTDYSLAYIGKVDYNDIASNIYDLEGNVVEFTQETPHTRFRIHRGGYYHNDYYCFPSTRGTEFSSLSNSTDGSRLSLYIK